MNVLAERQRQPSKILEAQMYICWSLGSDLRNGGLYCLRNSGNEDAVNGESKKWNFLTAVG